MAVPEGKRTESKLDVQTKAIELARYTKQICQKERIIPKRDRCYESWRAHAEKGDTYQVLQSMDVYYQNVWKEGTNGY